MSQAVADGFQVDYAASSRSRCNACKKTIDQGDLRMGPRVQSDKGDFKYPVWHHIGCFEDIWLKKNPDQLTDVAQVRGIDAIRFQDQKKVKGLVVGGDSSLETKAVTAEEKKLQQEDKLVWNRHENLEQLTNPELQNILEANDQPFSGKLFGGRAKLLTRCADGMVFGAIPKCPNCKEGDLLFTAGTYKCTGNIDEFAKCEFKATEIDRKPWKIPRDIADDYKFLSSYKFVKRERKAGVIEGSNPQNPKNPIMPDDQTVSSSKRERDADEDDEEASPPAADDTKGLQPLHGCSVICAGKLSKTQPNIFKMVTDNGGVQATTINAATHCICTSAEAAGNGSQKGRDAVKAGLLCVSEAWLEESIKQGRRLADDEIAPFVLANPRKVDADRIKRKEVAEKAAITAEAEKQRELMEESYKSQPNQQGKSQQGKSQGTKKLVIKGAGAVEPESGLVDEGHIYEPSKGEVYSTVMNLTDVVTGQNSFYIMQIIEHDSKKSWSVFRKWGKMGRDDVGGTKLVSYPIASSAEREFRKVFLEKTGNDWSNRKSCKRVYGKYMPVEVDMTGDETSGSASAKPTDLTYKGKLAPSVQSLVSLICDVKAMQDVLKEMEIDTTKMPLGKLSKSTIQEGYSALNMLQKTIEAAGEDAEKLKEARSKIVSGSNRFYNYIPHIAPEGGKLPLLDTLDILKAKAELLSTLQELEVASKLLNSGGDEASGEHPIDTHYNRLKTDFRAVPRADDEFRRINDYLQNTHAATHNMYSLELVDLFAIDRHDENARWEAKGWSNYPNRRLLWHGSRLTNWVGILSQGLRIAPPEAPSTGYMFGKGVYFADMSSKSANYCFTSSDKTTGILILCEVALGEMKTYKRAFFVDGLEAPYKSVYAIGKNHPDPKGTWTMPNGTSVPAGKGAPSGVTDTSLLYNEFIVYDVSQVRMRYLLRVNFNYKKKCGTFF